MINCWALNKEVLRMNAGTHIISSHEAWRSSWVGKSHLQNRITTLALHICRDRQCPMFRPQLIPVDTLLENNPSYLSPTHPLGEIHPLLDGTRYPRNSRDRRVALTSRRQIQLPGLMNSFNQVVLRHKHMWVLLIMTRVWCLNLWTDIHMRSWVIAALESLSHISFYPI